MTLLSVVIPAYNEEQGIASIVERTLAVRPALEAIGVGLELIVVDDGSRDRTAEVVARYPEVRLIRHAVNRGYGAALKTGFRMARGEWVGFLDADGTYPPEAFPELCRAMMDGADLVIGSRMAGQESEMPLIRRIGNVIFATLVSFVGCRRVSDSASGMRVLRRSVLPKLYPLPDGLNFTPVMSTRALHEEIRMVEVPICYRERIGRSKLSVVRDGLRFFSSIVETAMNYNPVRVLGGVGIGALLGALILLGMLVVLRLSGVTRMTLWTTLGVFAAQVLAVSGVSLFSLGATFNYLVSLFHKRPVRQGLFGRPLLRRPLERHFGWAGGMAMAAGVGLAGVVVWFGLRGWPVSRLWLYLLGGAMIFLVGLQLVVSWVLMVVLEALSRRELRVRCDLLGEEALGDQVAQEAVTRPVEQLA